MSCQWSAALMMYLKAAWRSLDLCLDIEGAKQAKQVWCYRQTLQKMKFVRIVSNFCLRYAIKDITMLLTNHPCEISSAQSLANYSYIDLYYFQSVLHWHVSYIWIVWPLLFLIGVVFVILAISHFASQFLSTHTYDDVHCFGWPSVWVVPLYFSCW